MIFLESLVCRRLIALITSLIFVVFLFSRSALESRSIFIVVIVASSVLASLVGQRRSLTCLGSLGQVDLEQAVLRHCRPIAAHLVAVSPAALLSMLLRTPSTRQERSMLSRHPVLRDARDAVDLADSGLGARIPGEPLIACLIKREVADLDDAEEEHGRAKEQSDHDRKYDHRVSQP